MSLGSQPPADAAGDSAAHGPRVLYVAMRHDYGLPANGDSFEETNFKSALVGMGCAVTHFDFMERKRVVGTRRMRHELLDVARNGTYDLVFLFLFTNEISPRTISRLQAEARAPVVNWFADDHWRFEGFSSRYAKVLDWAITTDEDSLPKYRRAGIPNVILSQWACNQYLYRPAEDARYDHDISFVGQPHGDRRAVIDRLGAEAGIEVACYGRGWPNGRVSTEDMITTFQRSRISLNLSNSSRPSFAETIARRAMRIGGTFGDRPPQIKGRTFEIPGCGGFQLTEKVPHLERYFEIGEEIAAYTDIDDLAEQIRFWLTHEERRVAVAHAGYRRVVRDHTYDARFREIFETVGVDKTQ